MCWCCGYLCSEREGQGTSIAWMTIAKPVSDGIPAFVRVGLFSWPHTKGRKHFCSSDIWQSNTTEEPERLWTALTAQIGTLSVGGRDSGSFFWKSYCSRFFCFLLPARGVFLHWFKLVIHTGKKLLCSLRQAERNQLPKKKEKSFNRMPRRPALPGTLPAPQQLGGRR